MLKATKKIMLEILKYIGVIIVYVGPVLLIAIGFDFIFDFKIDFFEKVSFLRMFVFVWFIFMSVLYIWIAYGDKIKKYIP